MSKEISNTEEVSFSYDYDEETGEDKIIIDEENCSYCTGEEGWSESSTAGAKEIHKDDDSVVKRRWLCALRFLVFGVLAATASLVGLQSARVSSRKIEDDFQEQFDVVARSILDESQNHARNMFASFSEMSIVATTLAQANSSSWPFVTLPNFDEWTVSPWVSSNMSMVVIVQSYLREAWEEYSELHAENWINAMLPSENPSISSVGLNITHNVWSYGPNGTKVDDPIGTAAVSWETTSPDENVINYNKLRNPVFARAFEDIREDGRPLLAGLVDGKSIIIQPIFKVVRPSIIRRDLVGFFYAEIPWKKYFEHILLENTKGIHVHVTDTCSESLAMVLHGPSVLPVNLDELSYDEKFDRFAIEETFDPFNFESSFTLSGCEYKVRVLPSLEYRAAFEKKNEQALSTFSVSIALFIVLFGAIIFLVYDWFLRRKQARILNSAKQSLALVNSLFPATIRDRILEKDNDVPNFSMPAVMNRTTKKISAVEFVEGHRDVQITKPIADLFPETTVMFADIVGFTAWSSVRDPPQVFTLLENIYDAFDQVAKRRGVFKVETIGDCYVAVCGIPNPRDDHAVVMAGFARRCLDRMLNVVADLEVLLGPETGDLGMRFGLHSGPVMAGVLRGDKSRFQLFGDTMNTTSRIEATGAKNRIHLSGETAALLVHAGREGWLVKRNSLVSAKGKGMLQTFWLDLTAIRSKTLSDGRHASNRALLKRGLSVSSFSQDGLARERFIATRKDSIGRLIDYNVQVLTSLLKKVVAMNPTRLQNSYPSTVISANGQSHTVIQEVAEVITFPSKPAKYLVNPKSMILPLEVEDQLRNYVFWVASQYHDCPFHSFDHASHVTMSVMKLLERVVTSQTIDYERMEYTKKAKSSKLHEYTFGIASDPLTQFALAFSALIHDIDHQGVPNGQLIKERASLAKKYQNQSVAEQNSVDLGWNMLMQPQYNELRHCICGSQEDMKRFRQLVVNVVMATDIVDEKLGAIRKRRWEKVFHPSGNETSSPEQESTNRKATIVIEHLMQASDVAHTMQHWHVFLRWNKRLFEEMYIAYKTGRGRNDPSEHWYTGEINFFDHYVIPLAKKLRECGVFGVSGDEYLAYAEANRNEWTRKGQNIVQGYLAEFNARSASAAAAAAISARRLVIEEANTKK